MKKITKILSIVLILLFIAIPVLQNLSGKGGVKAAEIKERTVTTIVYNESDIDAPISSSFINANRETATRQTVEYSYKVRFGSRFTMEEITKDELSQLKNGSIHIAHCTDSNYHEGQIRMKVADYKATKQKNGRYTVTGYMGAVDVITTKYYGTKNPYPMAKMFWGGFHAQSVYFSFSERNFSSARITWLVKTKAQVDWDSYFEDLYNPIPSQTTYTNNDYHYNNTTDNYQVDNVQSPEYQTITPVKTNTYTYVNINDDARRLFIRHLYKTVQRREPAAEDYVNYMKNNVQTNAIDVIMSKEANEKNNINGMSNENFVRLIYKAILCRDPDAEGLQNHTRLLNSGVQKTYVIKGIVQSNEFRECWNKQVKTLTFDSNVCTAVNDYLSNKNGVHIMKTSNTTIKMFADGVTAVKELDVSSKNLKNLSGISQFTNLTKLVANNNKFTDISEVSKLSNVTVLYMNNCGLGSIDNSPIKSMKKIEEVHAENNAMTNRAFKFSGTPTIKRLYMNGNQIATISETLLTNNLTELYLDNNEVVNTEEVDYSNLKKISLKNNKNGMNSRGVYKIIPQVVKNAQNKSSKLYATNGVVFNKCKIVGNDVVMDKGAAVATITIKGGAADGTVITFKNIDIAQ